LLAEEEIVPFVSRKLIVASFGNNLRRPETGMSKDAHRAAYRKQRRT
jgi:hypothetical protein